jgi:transposase
MYASDLTDGQWERLEPLLRQEGNNRHAGGRPRTAQTLDRREKLRVDGMVEKAEQRLRTQTILLGSHDLDQFHAYASEKNGLVFG